MPFIDDLRNQNAPVRRTLFVLSSVLAIALVGFYWWASIERQMFFALHDDAQERQDFLVQQDARMPQPLAAIAKVTGTLTASIGSLLGIDRHAGFDSTAAEGNNRGAVHLLPLSR